MAISDKQIFDWFLANPNADDATVAGAMDQFKLTPADIARATGANIADVQSRYNAATTPTAAPVAETSEVYLGDNRWLNTATGQIRTDWSQAAPVKQIVREEDRGGMHYRYYDDGSVDSSVLSTDNFLDFVGDVAPGIALKTALTMAGGPAGSELGLTLGSGLNTALDLGLSNAAQQAIGSGLIRGTLADATGGNFVTGALSGAAASSPNLTLGDTGITLGNLNTANKVLNANDAASVLSALAADKTISGATSGLLDASTTQALNTGLQVNNIVTQLQAGNEGAALTLLGDLAGSSDLKTAGNALKAIDAIESGNVGALTSAVVNLSNTAGSTTGSSSSTSGSTSGGSTTVGNFEDNEVTRLKGLGYTNAQIQDYFNTLDNLTGAFDEQSAILTDTTSGGGSTIATSNVDQDTADFLASIGITNLDQLTDSGLSNQDILDLINATDLVDDTVTVTGSNGNITDTTGLDTGEVIPTGGTGDDVEELVVTGDKDKTDTTTIDTITGGDGNDLTVDDKGEIVIKDKKESCPVGTVLNPETGECDPVTEVEDKGEVVIKDKKESCPVGTVLNPETGECDAIEDKGEVVIKDKKESCPIGTVLNPETGECDPIDDTITCPPGKVLNAEGTACIDEVVITDTKCDPGFVYDEDLKQCVPVEKEPLTCPTGFHLSADGLSCEPDDTKKELECPEGYEPNEAGTACIPVVVIKDKKCDPGFVYDEDLQMCVPIEDDKCAPGFHLENGLCVPDEEDCAEGYHRENGVCVPDDCPEGYVRNLETGACEKVKDDSCPVGQVRNAAGKCVPIVTTPPVVNPPVVKTTPTTYTPSTGSYVSGEETKPIYAEGMDEFDLFATLQQLLAAEPEKKDSKKSKEKTKMATGGHLDDLLAEQMTVDDLLKLLR